MINTEQWLDAAGNGDLETIKKAVAEGSDDTMMWRIQPII